MMSGAYQTRCIFCRLLPARPFPGSRPSKRKFHSTPPATARRKSAFTNVRAVNLGLVEREPAQQKEIRRREALQPALHDPRAYDPAVIQRNIETAASQFRSYTPRDKQLLALKYSPEQLAAIEAGESTIDPRDIALQGRMRDDSMRVEYKDDFSKILPVIDHAVRAPDEDIDPGIRPLSDREVYFRFIKWKEDINQKEFGEDTEGGYRAAVARRSDILEQIKGGIQAGSYPADGLTTQQRMDKLRRYAEQHETTVDESAAFDLFCSDPSNFFYSPRGKLHSQQDVSAQELPKMKDPRVVTVNETEDPHTERLMMQTGLDADAIKNLNTKALVKHFVVNQTRMGKIDSMYCLSMAGNGKGMLGIGEGKSTEPEEAIRKSRMNAIRNMKPIPLYEERTIYGEVEAKVGASIVKLSARPPGFGNRCQSLIFELARAAGLRDLSARCLRSRNKMNVVKAAYEALMSQRIPEEVAMARGRKMVDVRQVYYGAQATPPISKEIREALQEQRKQERELEKKIWNYKPDVEEDDGEAGPVFDDDVDEEDYAGEELVEGDDGEDAI